MSCLDLLTSSSPQRTSITALYDAIINRTGSARPATPSQMQVTGSGISRTVSWNDNTCPSTVTFRNEMNENYIYDLVENQEQGFHVWRKTTAAQWDSTLTGYAIVGTAGTNAASFLETTPLVGTYSYVVTAYNAGGDAAPRVETKRTFAPETRVVSPNGGEVIPGNQNITIQWAT